jgi:hypothetical protein
MAHFAQINKDNFVEQVIVVNNEVLLDENGNESEAKGIAFCQSLLGGNWVQTSYSGSFRKNFAGIGYTYDPINNYFFAPQPFPSWTLDADAKWQPPVRMPEGETLYQWDETTLSWIAPTNN